MRVSGLTSSRDWRFGKGRAGYVTRSNAIRQNVVTRLRSFTNDWFVNVNEGLPWLEMLGQKGNERRVLREVENTVLSTEGVKTIERLRINAVDQNRNAEIELVIIDIFDERIQETVLLP